MIASAIRPAPESNANIKKRSYSRRPLTHTAMKSTSSSTNTGKTRSVRFQFSLRTMGIVALLVALASVYLTEPLSNYQRERSVAKQIEALGGTCHWVNPTPNDVSPILKSTIGRIAFLQRRLEQLQQRLSRIELRNETVSPELVTQLSKCECLKRLTLDNVDLTNAMVRVLASTDSLVTLDIRNKKNASRGRSTVTRR